MTDRFDFDPALGGGRHDKDTVKPAGKDEKIVPFLEDEEPERERPADEVSDPAVTQR